MTLCGKRIDLQAEKAHTCCEIRLKCLTLPRLSLLAIACVQTPSRLHFETRSVDQQNHLTAILKDGTTARPRM